MLTSAIAATIITGGMALWVSKSPETLMVAIMGAIFWMLMFAIVYGVTHP